MSTAAPRRSRALVATLVALLVVAPSFVSLSAASAAPGGYTGTGDGATDIESNGGNRTLPLMTGGVAYTGSLTGPQFGGSTDWCWEVSGGSLPTGITMSVDGECAPSATFSGTPEAGNLDFVISLHDTANEVSWDLTFTGTVESGKSPTTTTLVAPEVGAHTGFTVSATVAGDPSIGHTPTGTVEFYATDAYQTTLVGSATLIDGVATATATLDKSRAARDQGVTARYLGDDDYQPSTSTSHSVLAFVPTAIGTVTWNGSPAEGVTVDLLAMPGGTVVIDTATTDAAGVFEVSPGEISTTADVDKNYLLRATFADDAVVYQNGGTSLQGAYIAGPRSWKNTIFIPRISAPVWSDAVLATPRIGATYSDAVTAASPNPVTYSVSAGALPDGLSLDAQSGAVTGVPTDCGSECAYWFTISGVNGYGTATQMFIGEVLPAGVAPTWDDDEIAGLRVGVATDEAVVAVGDPTITYAVTAGTLPAGVTLWPSTGALSGTPTTAGDYEFTITATNAFGSVDAVFEGEVAAAPVIDLTLEFAPGTALEDAASTISADGLQVGSTYTLTMFSTPRVLYTGTVGGSGGFSWVVSLPADTPPGAHRLLLTGTAVDGTPMSAQAWFTLGSNGKILAISYTGPTGGLAATGIEPGGAALTGGLLLVLGFVLTVARRRRAA